MRDLSRVLGWDLDVDLDLRSQLMQAHRKLCQELLGVNHHKELWPKRVRPARDKRNGRVRAGSCDTRNVRLRSVTADTRLERPRSVSRDFSVREAVVIRGAVNPWTCAVLIPYVD